ncbi:hypothetical protein SAMN04488029_1807 [Reichenbachiella faecimaris]|uniref:Uncharacterized protein n=1 Tax=Reichenbachiella faecimaris TaxID=692418 RepID=A0A1W2GBI4_REIFA|nr:hypothetical protein [Reichenbachiella faecimaris]SMD34039.1 hypothetical protein SAMN04488029_1807 [Reichenbachiella faecimaris]
MTRYDIRLRRKALSKGQIQRHMDFKGLYPNEPKESGKGRWFRILAIVLAALAIGAMMYAGIKRIEERPAPTQQEDVDIFDEFKTE